MAAPNHDLRPYPQFNAEQWASIQALAGSLTPDQALWISGYLTGASQARQTVQVASRGASAESSPASAASVAASARALTILYGSETGNAADVARRIEARARALGMPVSISDMATYKVRRLRDERDVLVVTSTHGEGDPPEPAADFFEFVLGHKAPRLAGLRYAVLGLGDSTYEKFCEAARRLDTRFEELGAERLVKRLDCDVDYENVVPGWVDDVLGKLTAELAAAPGAEAPPGIAAPTVPPEEPAYGKRHPFPAEVIENIVLTGRGSSKETRHVELSLAGSGLSWQPGDSLGLLPQNDPALVDGLLEAAGLDAADPIQLKAEGLPLREALRTRFEITALTPRFIAHWAELADAPPLRELLADGRRSELSEFMRAHQIIDVVRTWPVKGLAGAEFTAGLRALQARLYSIASSASAAPDEAHLTVAALRYEVDGRARAGVASVHLAERTREGDTLPVYIQSNAHFRLPEDPDRPIIMIGAGTGVAPYRAFLQEREAHDIKGGTWLFFGERNFRTDFLYQLEWQGLMRDGILSRMDVAFSRDQDDKVYVHHRMREQARELYAWLEEGAHVYVCGDAAALAPDVHEALTDIVAQQGGLTRDNAEEYIRALQRDARYQRDVY